MRRLELYRNPSGNLLGIPPTGKEVKLTGIAIYRIADGKTVEERGEEDFLGVFRQIGLIQQPGQKS
ncbi:MAG TPA: ester cyclase [Anaerolineae bacterium]|nr:ester cyclase [Anaerolineae bacterium]